MSGPPESHAKLGTMETEPTSSMLSVVAQDILPIFPSGIRQMIELALPSIALQAARLGLEVMDAEQRGLKYSEAVQRGEFIKMQRVYFAASNLLQQPLSSRFQRH
jgi:hypothetical protein